MYPNYINFVDWNVHGDDNWVWVQVNSSYVLIGKNEISKEEGKGMICVNKFLMFDLLH